MSKLGSRIIEVPQKVWTLKGLLNLHYATNVASEEEAERYLEQIKALPTLYPKSESPLKVQGLTAAEYLDLAASLISKSLIEEGLTLNEELIPLLQSELLEYPLEERRPLCERVVNHVVKDLEYWLGKPLPEGF